MNPGDHHTSGPAVGPDGHLYFGQGTMTNAAVVGEDNERLGWLSRFPERHDLPCADVTLSGGPDDRWIFQIAGGLLMASAKSVVLAGGARAENIVWQVFGSVEIGTASHFEGVVLCQTDINLRTGASVNGRLLAQTAVNLDQNDVTEPAP